MKLVHGLTWSGWVVVGVLAMSASLGCKKKKNAIDYAPDYGGGTDAQTYVPKSGLVKIHYPSDLVANPSSEHLTFLEPMRTASVDLNSLVTITTNPDPISQDPNEYARVLQGARAKALTGYRLISTTPGHCWKDQQGVETRWEFDDGGNKLQGRACAFIHHKHGYSFMYAFKPGSIGDEPKLKKIVDATELTD